MNLALYKCFTYFLVLILQLLLLLTVFFSYVILLTDYFIWFAIEQFDCICLLAFWYLAFVYATILINLLTPLCHIKNEATDLPKEPISQRLIVCLHLPWHGVPARTVCMCVKQQGADVDAVNTSGDTPLHCAVKHGSLLTADMLINSITYQQLSASLIQVRLCYFSVYYFLLPSACVSEVLAVCIC